MLVLGELKVAIILKYFGFLGSVCGRGMFLIFVGSLLFDTSVL